MAKAPVHYVWGIELSPDSSQLLVWDHRKCAIWDIRDGRQVLKWAPACEATFCARRKKAVTTGGLAELWNITGEYPPYALSTMSCPGYPDVSFSFGLVLSPNTNVAYSGAGRKILELDFDRVVCTPFPDYHFQNVCQLVHHPTDPTLFSTDLSNLHAFEWTGSKSQEIICEWDTRSRTPRRTFVGGLGVGTPRLAVSPDGAWLIIFEPHVAFRCISLVDYSVISSEAILANNACGVAFHPSGTKFAVFDGDIWVFTCPDLKLVNHLKDLPGTTYPSYGCGFVEDGTVVYCSSGEGVVYRVDPRTGHIASRISLF